MVLLVHGLGEHSGRYTHVAQCLTSRQYAVYAIDHRGHGRSEGPRTYFPRFESAVDDLDAYFQQLSAANRDKPIFTYGHSLGTLIALRFALRRQADLAGLIITGTPLNLESQQPSSMVWLGSLLQKFAPKLPLPGLLTTSLSHDPAIIEAFDRDPLNNHGGIPLRMGHHIIYQSRFIRARLHQLKLPLLVLHGTDDLICPPSGSQIAYEQTNSIDKSLKLYPDMYHEIHNEPGKEAVLGDIVKWLDHHTPMGLIGN